MPAPIGAGVAAASCAAAAMPRGGRGSAGVFAGWVMTVGRAGALAAATPTIRAPVRALANVFRRSQARRSSSPPGSVAVPDTRQTVEHPDSGAMGRCAQVFVHPRSGGCADRGMMQRPFFAIQGSGRLPGHGQRATIAHRGAASVRMGTLMLAGYLGLVWSRPDSRYGIGPRTSRPGFLLKILASRRSPGASVSTPGDGIRVGEATNVLAFKTLNEGSPTNSPGRANTASKCSCSGGSIAQWGIGLASTRCVGLRPRHAAGLRFDSRSCWRSTC